MNCDALLKIALDVLENIALDCAIEAANDAEQKYSATFRPERIKTAIDDVDTIKGIISEIKTYFKNNQGNLK